MHRTSRSFVHHTNSVWNWLMIFARIWASLRRRSRHLPVTKRTFLASSWHNKPFYLFNRSFYNHSPTGTRTVRIRLWGWVARSPTCSCDCVHVNVAPPQTIFIHRLRIDSLILMYISVISSDEYSRKLSDDYLSFSWNRTWTSVVTTFYKLRGPNHLEIVR